MFVTSCGNVIHSKSLICKKVSLQVKRNSRERRAHFVKTLKICVWLIEEYMSSFKHTTPGYHTYIPNTVETKWHTYVSL